MEATEGLRDAPLYREPPKSGAGGDGREAERRDGVVGGEGVPSANRERVDEVRRRGFRRH